MSRSRTSQRTSGAAAIALGLALVAGAGCRASATPEEVAAATLFFPPIYRHLEEPRWCFSDAERLKALDVYRERGADSLFELIVDAEGVPKRVRIVRTPIEEIYHDRVFEIARAWRFSPDKRGAGYRAFYCPVDLNFQPTFEWL